MNHTRPRSRVQLCGFVLAVMVGLSLPGDALAAAKRRPASRSKAVAAVRQTQARAKSGQKDAGETSSIRSVRTVAARATAGRGVAARKARENRDAAQPRFKTDATGALVPDIRAEAAIIYSPETGKVLWEENSQDQRSIASITKVMTATVFLESDPDLTREVVVERPDVYQASTTHLRAGYRVTTGDLLHLLLIASDNAAARALARVSPQGRDAFIERMNQKAAELGLENTHYEDPSGLLSANVSSAYDMARLIAYVSTDERIASVMRTPYYSFRSNRGLVQVHSTNRLVMQGDVDVQAGKTGFIRSAGYCLATLLRLPQGSPVAVVVLGAKSNAGRFWETRHLFNWLSTKGVDFVHASGTPTAQE